MYDLRDPNYLPPHLRAHETERDNVVPLVQPKQPEPTLLRSKSTGLKYTWDCAEAAIILMRAAGLLVGSDEEGLDLRPDLQGLNGEELGEALVLALGRLCAAELEKPGRKGRPIKYPFATLEVGDEFVVAKNDKQPKESSFRVYCINQGHKHGRKFKLTVRPDGSYEVKRES